MMIEEPNSPTTEIFKQKRKGVLNGLELEGYELSMISLKVSKEVGTIAEAADEVSQDKGLEVEA